MTARLYVVATPIGNLEDMTLRAIATLKNVALIAAEDTRRTSILLRHFGISTPMTSYHEHNERQKLPFLLGKLTAGGDLALVSDAGTPVVADPGQRLISAAVGYGIPVVSIPGPSAVLAALTVSGFPGDEFIFAGFVPSRSNDRKLWLSRFAGESRPVIFFEAPHRIRKTMTELRHIYVERPIIVARELTKIHEQVIRATTLTLEPEEIAEKGEFVVVLGPESAPLGQPQSSDPEQIASFFYRLTKINGLGRRPALTKTAHYFGLSTKSVYSLIERAKRNGPS